MEHQVDFLHVVRHPLKLQEYDAVFSYDQNTCGQSVCIIFKF